MAVAPITHAPPHDPQNALQLPLTTKFRLGLDDQMSWIVLDDLNYFTWPGHDLRPADPRDPSKGIAFGYLPAAITSRIIGRVRDLMRAGRAKLTDRD